MPFVHLAASVGRTIPAQVFYEYYGACTDAVELAQRLCETRCSILPFMRSAGQVHSRALKSTSSHRIPNTSPVREPVRQVNIRAFAAIADRLCKSAQKAGTPCQAIALWCFTTTFTLGNTRASRISVTGFSPVR